MTTIGKETARRTEEIQDIVDKMPTSFGRTITLIIILILGVCLYFGWLVRYPDIVVGELHINAVQSPVKLVAPASGKLKLHRVRSGEKVSEGQIVGLIQNPASLDNIHHIDSLLLTVSFPVTNASLIYSKFSSEVTLGELSGSYFSFLNAVKQLADFQQNKIFDHQIAALNKLAAEQSRSLAISNERSRIGLNNKGLYEKFANRDSVLLAQKVISKADFDLTKIKSSGAEDQYQATLRDIANSRERLSQTESQVQEVTIMKIEKARQLELDVETKYNALAQDLRAWRQRYLFIAPFEGQLQFLKFWNDDQFTPSGEPVFTIVPEAGKSFGQVRLPAQGAGKVKVGQEVIVKLDNYPYLEYGTIQGYVQSISLTTNEMQTDRGSFQTYLVTVDLPKSLETNYGTKLDFKYEISGTAEIITNDRRLIQRLFDNLKYRMKQ